MTDDKRRKTLRKSSLERNITMAVDYKALANKFLASWQKERTQKIKICLFGQPGAGKSSLINELVGQKVAQVGQGTDTTRRAQIVETPDVIYVDLPGYGTSLFPENKYFTGFNPLQYDLFLCVFAGKLHEADVDFFCRVARTGRPCLFIRNKCDGLYDAKRSRRELEQGIADDVHKQIGQGEQVLFTSCRHNVPAAARGIPELEAAIGGMLPEAVQAKFYRHAKAYTQEALLLKRTCAEASLKRFMLLAAGNGLNPVLGMDAVIDAQILKKMYQAIREAFGIGEKEVEPEGPASQVVKRLAEGVTGERVTKGLTYMLRRRAEGRAAKLIPLAGGLAVMGFNAGSMYFLGQKYIEQCYAYAKQRLAAEIVMGAV